MDQHFGAGYKVSVGRKLQLLVAGTALVLTPVIAAIWATNPLRLGPHGVTLWFVGLLAGASGLMAIVLYILKSYWHAHDSRQTQFSYSLRQGLLIGSTLAILLALSSLRQLSLRDTVLILVLMVLIEFYFRTRR